MRSRHQFKAAKSSRILAADDPALIEGRTIMLPRVRSARDVYRVLIPGEENAKIGGKWEKGWPGTRIFTLTLEERATCPRSCPQWASCYGNNQPYALRIKHDQYLIPKLATELPLLAWRFPKFSVRLHQLGDFFSVAYAAWWIAQLDRFPGLHLFGFTARDRRDPIGQVIELASQNWDRCRIRFSNDSGARSASVIEDAPRGTNDGATTCPAQTGDAPKCESCGLCLTTKKPIVFTLHGSSL